MGTSELSLAGLADRLRKKSHWREETLSMSTPVLHVEHITMQFGGVVAVNDLDGYLSGEIRRPHWRAVQTDHSLFLLHHRRL